MSIYDALYSKNHVGLAGTARSMTALESVESMAGLFRGLLVGKRREFYNQRLNRSIEHLAVLGGRQKDPAVLYPLYSPLIQTSSQSFNDFELLDSTVFVDNTGQPDLPKSP